MRKYRVSFYNGVECCFSCVVKTEGEGFAIVIAKSKFVIDTWVEEGNPSYWIKVEAVADECL